MRAPRLRRPIRGGAALVAALSIVALGGASGPASGEVAPGSAAAADRAETAIGSGRGGFRASRLGRFKNPVYVHGPSGAKGLIFVVEQQGRIRLLKRGRKLNGRFLDIRGRVRAGGEQGLMSVAFPPAYPRNRRFYVFFTDARGDLVVREYRRARKRPRKARPRSGRTVIKIRHRQAANHNGGQLQFGPDRKLYIATGDGGGSGDPEENAQDKSSLLGKILRIDPRRKGKRRYTVPRGNPFRGRPGRREIYSLGLRNPYRFSFDRTGRRIAIGDVGQDAREEVDYESLGTARGANFGWDAFEGSIPFASPDASPAPKRHEPPIFDYAHGGGNCAITGGYVVRDKRVPSLLGRYLYADFCRGQIRSLIPALSGATGDRSAGLPDQSGISSFGEDARGRIHFTNLLTGEVYRIDPE
jgi:glucose/arabinose dehydrogenase